MCRWATTRRQQVGKRIYTEIHMKETIHATVRELAQTPQPLGCAVTQCHLQWRDISETKLWCYLELCSVATPHFRTLEAHRLRHAFISLLTLHRFNRRDTLTCQNKARTQWTVLMASSRYKVHHICEHVFRTFPVCSILNRVGKIR